MESSPGEGRARVRLLRGVDDALCVSLATIISATFSLTLVE